MRVRESAEALGTAPVGRLLWRACSQTTLSVGVYGIYALTNAWFVARGVGAEAMAAVNLVAPVLLVLGAVSTTVGAGGASLVSRALGAGDAATAGRAAGNAFTVFWGAAVVVTALGLLGVEPLLTALGARDGAREVAREYAVVILAGSVLSTGFSSLVRAEGRLRFSTLLWLAPVLVQISLDPVLIFGFDLGVRGAALGTVGGQAVSALLSLWFFFVQRERPYRVRAADLLPHGPTVRALLGIGAPSFLAGFGTTLLAVLVNTALAGAGAAALAAYAVAARVQTFATMPLVGIGQGLQPVVGYNAGRGLHARVVRAKDLALRVAVGYGLVASALVVVFAGLLVSVFLDDPAVAGQAATALRFVAVGFAAAGITPLVAGYAQSLGATRQAWALAVGTLALVRAPLVVVLGGGGTTGVWVALAAGEVGSALCALVVLRRLRPGGVSAG
ncbi:MATE family efflux transporter [Actinosynnema pretiosum subsp. pretiosum]|uniref:MATE family efflux transporter n=1 Tax=Actinosynnema pretiosum subsp. pretiosum TaxID=103721 RepID=A0AA45L694_9PSEU|nr:MATE family efflux transporter [Actinosynnema pretiosum subsp. pretiosum]